MKKLFLLLFIITLIGCTPTRHFVSVERNRNFYQHHRHNSYTVPTWVPGFGIMLETRIYRPYNRSKQPIVRRKHR